MYADRRTDAATDVEDDVVVDALRQMLKPDQW
jgi:hypothetical protein